MNKILKTLLDRCSCRSYKKKKIDKDILDKIIKAGERAPTSGNLQPYSIILARDTTKKEFMSKVTGMKFIEDADVLLFFIIDFARLKRWAELNNAPFVMEKSFRHFLTSVHDIICCAQNIVIASESFGLGSVYIGKVIELYKELKAILQLPKLTFPIALLSLGHTEKKKEKLTLRLARDSILHDETYEQADDKMIISWFSEKYKSKKIDLSDKSKWLYLNVIRTALGEKKFLEAKEELDEKPCLNIPQYLFGIQYQSHVMPKLGYKIKLDLVEAGFECFQDDF